MAIIKKKYKIPTGEAEFVFQYAGIVTQISKFEIINIGEVSKGYDNENNLDIAVYPSNFQITIDTFNEGNYKAFRTLYQLYNATYPNNAENLFSLVFKINGVEKFRGMLYEMNSSAEGYNLGLTFVDGINFLKSYYVFNPSILDYLYNAGIIPRSQNADFPEIRAYGFANIYWITDPSFTGYFVSDIESGDKDTNLKKTIHELFKLINPNIELELDNRFLFKDILVGSPEVTITDVEIRRILSNLFGRYVVIDKLVSPVENQIVTVPNTPEYTHAEYFNVIFESDQYKVYEHTWNGETQNGNTVLKWEKGVNEKTVSDILKLIAKNLFSYFGFKNNKVFFRHRRYISDVAGTLNDKNIISMDRALTVSRIQGVRIEDYYTNNYAIKGLAFNEIGLQNQTYKIPFNAFGTANAPFFEYRLKYKVAGVDYRVIYFVDQENIVNGEPVTDIPQETISKAEWNSHRIFRDKYDIVLIGVNYEFDKTYNVNYRDFIGRHRIINLSENYLTNTTKITTIEIENA